MVAESSSARSRIATKPIPGLVVVRGGGCFEALAVVFDFELQRIGLKAEAYPGLAGAGMACDVI